MASINRSFPLQKHDFQMAFVVTRREVRDSFRDWRIIIPIFLLTLGFPALMNFTAQRLLNFVEDYGASIIATQLIPFLLLVVGFFPMSFSLIIALEAFVGEKERKSLEPLLATPLTNTQLYMGKMAASLVPPLMASYAGMIVYMTGLWFTVDWRPELQLVLQVLALTTIQGIIMVAAAVIVSSQATSVRAANLLASFIIVPMALLIQGEAAALFWGNYAGLWWLVAALAFTAMILIRMGVSVFNREELLGRDIDQIRIGWMIGQFWGRFSGKDATENGRYPSITAWYRGTVALLPKLRYPVLILMIAFVGAIVLGIVMSQRYQFPPELQAEITSAQIAENLDQLQILVGELPLFIFFQNIRVMLLLTILGIFSLGVLGILIFMLPWGVIAFLGGQLSLAGENPFTFILGTVVPHATVELPALLIIAAAALRWHTVAISPPPNRTISESFLWAAGDFARIFIGIGIPLLLVASFVEAYITPLVLAQLY